jgi:hypothetical protein
VVAEKLERPTLSKDSGLLMDRAVMETEAEFAGDAVSVRQLNPTTRGEKFVVHIAEHDKAVKKALKMADRHLIREQSGRQQKGASDQQTAAYVHTFILGPRAGPSGTDAVVALSQECLATTGSC